MERAVRMQFANVVVDTWVEGGLGQTSLRRSLASLVERLAHSAALPHNLQLREQAGLLCLSCPDLEADLEALRRERASAVFSIGPHGETLPLTMPGMAEAPSTPKLADQAQTDGDSAEGLLIPLFPQAASPAPQAVPGADPSPAPPGTALTSVPLGLREALRQSQPAPQAPPRSQPRPQRLTLGFAAPDGHPLAGYRVRFHWSGGDLECHTGPDGQLGLDLPPSIACGDLTLYLSDEPGHALCWTLDFVDRPATELERVRQALLSLGYASGSLDDRFDLSLAQALACFQTDMGLEPSGALDQATAALLETGACAS